MDIEKYEEFIKQGKFYRPSNYICDALGLLNLTDGELVLIMYIHRWITKPKHHIFDFEVLRDLCWTRNRLLANRKLLIAKGYLTAEYETVFNDDLGFKSTGYLYDMNGLYEKIYKLSALSDAEYKDAKNVAYENVRTERLSSGKHLRFLKPDLSSEEEQSEESQNRDSTVPAMESSSSYYGTEKSHDRAPSKTNLKQNKNKNNTTEVVKPSAIHEEPKVPSESEDMSRKLVPQNALGENNAHPSPAHCNNDDEEAEDDDDIDYDALLAQEDTEYLKRKAELEHPSDIFEAVIKWFRNECNSPDHYIASFRKANIPEEKLRQFWAIRDKWKYYNAIKRTDRSLFIFTRNIDGFLKAYWEEHVEEIELDRQSKDFQEQIWEHQRLLDKYGVWRVRDDDWWGDDAFELRTAAGIIRSKERFDSTPFYWWACNTCHIKVKDGQLFIGNHRIEKNELSKEAVLARVEALRHPVAKEIVPDEKFEEELLASLKETEEPHELSALEKERFEKILAASLEEDD